MLALDYQVIKTTNGQVGYCQYGNGIPLILLVGYSGTLYHWNYHFVVHLAKYFTVFLLDNRKIGLSDSSNEYSMLGLAQDVADFIHAKQLVRPNILGWSMGGMIAQTLVKKFPDLIASMALLATIPHYSYISTDFANLLTNSQHLSTAEFKTQLHAMFFSLPATPELKNLVTSNSLTINNYPYRFNPQAKQLQDYATISWSGLERSCLNQLALPSLIIWAKNDLVVQKTASDILTKEIPHAKLIVYPSGGHFLLHQFPQYIANDIINFFTQLID
jgi:pimeloyl-ACP methyl ester carboxylesterase